MYKIKLLAIGCALFIGMHAHADEITAYVSGNNRIDVALSNSTSYVAFQMDITLPAGCGLTSQAVESKRLGKEMPWATAVWVDNSDHKSQHKIFYQQTDVNANVWRLVGYSMDNHSIDGLSGLNIFTLHLDGEASDLQNALQIQNVKVVNQAMEEVNLSATIAALPQFGDVNQDGSVDILDVIATTDLQAGSTSAAYRSYVADNNQDGAIEADDALRMAQSALQSSSSLSIGAQSELGIQPAQATAGEQTKVWVYASSETGTPRGLVLDVQLPDGWSFDDEALEWSATNWTMAQAADNRYVAYALDYNDAFAQRGNVFALLLNVPEGTADGYYPILTKAGSMLGVTGTTGDGWENVTQVSYVRVGNPTTATLGDGTLMSVALAALNNDQDLTRLDMSAIKAIQTPEEGFAFVDGRELIVPAEKNVVVSKATYQRAIAEGNLASVKLPFTTTEGRFYTPTQNEDGWVTFAAQDGLSAHAPAVADADIAVSAENVTLDADQLNSQSTEGYYLKANRMYSVNGTLNLRPYRTTFTFPNAVRGFSFDTPTGIQNVELEGANAVNVYDLSGRRATLNQPGIVITQGKKRIIK